MWRLKSIGELLYDCACMPTCVRVCSVCMCACVRVCMRVCMCKYSACVCLIMCVYVWLVCRCSVYICVSVCANMYTGACGVHVLDVK